MKNLSKKTIIIGLLLVLGTSVFAQSIKFSAKDINNKNVTEAIFADSKVTMINVWGTFCGPCIREMPDLAALSKKYDSKDFQIVGIVIDAINTKGVMNPKTVNSAKNIVMSTGADYLHIVPDASLLKILSDVYAVPTTFFVDSKGNIIGRVYTGSRNLEQWQEIIDSLLK